MTHGVHDDRLVRMPLCWPIPRLLTRALHACCSSSRASRPAARGRASMSSTASTLRCSRSWRSRCWRCSLPSKTRSRRLSLRGLSCRCVPRATRSSP
eukprot:358972-Chlamydomonas_euryale.AAC.8